MNVLLDARPAYGGTARYVRELVRLLEGALPPGALSLVGDASLRWGAPPSPARGGVTRRAAGAMLGMAWRIATDHIRIARMADAVSADLFHGTMGVIPLRPAVPAVVTCHDLWALDHPGERPGGLRARYERTALAAALRNAAHIIASSDTTARRVRERTGRRAQAITRIYPPLCAPVTPAAPAAVGHDEPFWLSVGTLEPRKNLARLVAAQRAAFPSTRVPLLLAGRYGWNQQDVLQAVRRSDSAVRWLGHVTDAELAWLYDRAVGLVQFSRDEGFDYPSVEGMRAGTPLLLSDIPVHREVAGPAARYVAPDDTAALTRALVECTRGGTAWRAESSEAGRARAAEIAVQTDAGPYLELYSWVTRIRGAKGV